MLEKPHSSLAGMFFSIHILLSNDTRYMIGPYSSPSEYTEPIIYLFDIDIKLKYNSPLIKKTSGWFFHLSDPLKAFGTRGLTPS